jgi:uncharacterized protein (DUF427 family)
VSLTSGRGPLSKNPAGRFVPPIAPGSVYVEPFRRRVRGITGGRTVVDSERVLLVHRAGAPPAYAFPVADAADVPTEAEPAAPGHVQVAWGAVEEWFEEEEPVRLHARNPYHRVDCLKTSRRLRVEVGGGVLVDTTDTVAVYETALEPRLYVRPEHVRTGSLAKSPTTTFCPYKGVATYWTAELDGSTVEDVGWSYEEPFPEAEKVHGLLSFDGERVTVLASFPE